MDVSARLLRNSVLRFANFALAVVISFFMMPFLVRHLGDRMYGVWTLVGTILGYYGMLDIGLSSAVVRYLSRAQGAGDKTEVRRVFCTAFYLFLALGTVSAMLTWSLMGALSALVKNPSDLRVFRVLLLLLGLSFSFDFPVRAFNAVFTSVIRDDLSVALSVSKTIASTVLVAVAIAGGHGIIALAVVTVSFSLADSIARVIVAQRLEPAVSIRWRDVDRALIKPLFHYSAYTFVGRIGDILRYRLDNLVITAFVGLSGVTHFFIAGRLVEYLKDSLSQMMQVVTPVFSQDEGRNDYEGIRRKFSFLIKLSLYVAVFSCSMAAIYGRRFIWLWMGPQYEDAYPVLLALLAGVVIRLIQLPGTALLYGISKHKYYTYTTLVEGTANLILSIWLVKPYGLLGVALGTAIPMAVIGTTVEPWYICRVSGLSWPRYVATVLGHASLALALVFAGRFFTRSWSDGGYGSLVLASLLQLAIYAPLAFFAGFTGSQRATLRRSVVASVPRVRRVRRLETSLAVAGK